MLTIAFVFLLASRELTVSVGIDDVRVSQELRGAQWQGSPKYYAPLLLECSTLAWGDDAKTAITNRYYYCWLFGATLQIPFARQHVDAVSPEQTFPAIADKRLLNRGLWGVPREVD